MREIQIFSAKWDKYFSDIISDIKEALKEKHLEQKVKVKIFDVDDSSNNDLFERHIIKLERHVGVPENPVIAIPLVVIDDEPFSLGTSPTFKGRLLQRM